MRSRHQQLRESAQTAFYALADDWKYVCEYAEAEPESLADFEAVVERAQWDAMDAHLGKEWFNFASSKERKKFIDDAGRLVMAVRAWRDEVMARKTN